ncbi:MAG: hypothetical protein ACR2QW_09990 [bacterium]
MKQGKRAGEAEGRQLTPGERFKNWVSGLITLWPIVLFLIGGTAAVNRDAFIQKTDDTTVVEEVVEVQAPPETNEKVCPEVDLTPVLKAIRAIDCDVPEGHSKLHE